MVKSERTVDKRFVANSEFFWEYIFFLKQDRHIINNRKITEPK